MLPRAALRGLQRPLPVARCSLSSHLTSGASRLSVRSYAASKRPPPPPPFPQSSRSKPPAPRNSLKDGANSSKKQSPPSTNPRKSAHQTPVLGTRPDAARAAPLGRDSSAQEPMAQKFNADEPVPGSLRDRTHDAQAAAENTEAPQQPEEESVKPQQPLPDLRQGLPSTFAFEFGDKSADGKAQGSAEEGSASRSEAQGEGKERSKDNEERDYDRAAYETSLDRRRAQMANYLYASILAIATAGALWLARPLSTEDDLPAGLSPEEASGWTPSSMYNRVRARFGSQVSYFTEPTFPQLLPEVPETQRPPFTLVLSLEDLLVHSEWDRRHGSRIAKRPGIDYFIRYLSQYYELVLFTSTPKMLADPVMMKLDPYHFVMWQLGREATKYEGGEYVKDLSYLNRPLNKTIIIDTRAGHVKNQPENAIVLPKWNGDVKDPHAKDLVGLIPFLEYVATMGVEDVRTVLKSFEGTQIPEEFARREGEARKKFMEQLEADKVKKPRKSLGSLAGMLGMKSSPAMSGGMVLGDGLSVAEGLAQGKMLTDQIREQGQKQYEHIEQQIREHGAQWLKEEEEEQKKLIEASMKDMKKGWLGSWSKE